MKALYRIVNVLLAVIIIPIILFSPIIKFQVSPKFETSEAESDSLVSQFLDGIGLAESLSMFGIEETISLGFVADVLTGDETFWYGMFIEGSELDVFSGEHGMIGGIWKIVTGQVEFSDSGALDEVMEKFDGRLTAVIAGFSVALLSALFVIIWSFISNKRLPTLAAGLAGLIGTIVMICTFNSIAADFMSGEILITEFIPAGSNWLVSFAAGFIGVDLLTFAGFHTGMIFVFAAIIVWSVSFFIIEIGETPEEKEKEKQAEKEKLAYKAAKKAEKQTLKALKKAEKLGKDTEEANEARLKAEKARAKAEKAMKKAGKA